MASKKRRESGRQTLNEPANDWFLQFLKHLEINFLDEGLGLLADAGTKEYALAALNVVKTTLRESGLSEEEIQLLWEQSGLKNAKEKKTLVWSAKMNQRRFELIDGEIQGTLTNDEQLELAGLTELMRQQFDAEECIPLEGTKILHRHLLELEAKSSGS